MVRYLLGTACHYLDRRRYHLDRSCHQGAARTSEGAARASDDAARAFEDAASALRRLPLPSRCRILARERILDTRRFDLQAADDVLLNTAASIEGAAYRLLALTMPLPDEIFAEWDVVFHDTRADLVDPDTHAEFVIARVLDRGTLRSVGAVLRYYGRDRIHRFLCDGGADRISRRTLPLSRAFLQIPPDECTPRSSRRHNSPFWTA